MLWECNGQGPGGREKTDEKPGKPGGRVMWLHGISIAFSFPFSSSPSPLAEPVPPSGSLRINSKTTKFWQRKGLADISVRPQCNGERKSCKPGSTGSISSHLKLSFNAATTNLSKVQKGDFLSLLVILLPDNLNV